MRKFAVIGSCIVVLLILSYFFLFAAPQGNAEAERFAVPLDAARADAIKSLADGGFIKSSFGFNIALLLRGKFGAIAPGGYKISKSQNVFQIAGILSGEPYMKWVVIPEGERKEQIADTLAETLGWNDQTRNDFLNYYSFKGPDYKEGCLLYTSDAADE